MLYATCATRKKLTKMYFHQAKTKKCVGQKGFGEDNGGGDDDNRRRKGGGELKKQKEKEKQWKEN